MLPSILPELLGGGDSVDKFLGCAYPRNGIYPIERKVTGGVKQIGPSAPPPAQVDGFRSVSDNRSFGRYELLLEVGQGGMATLYLARLRGVDEFEKVVIIKKIHDHLAREPDFVAMFRDEAQIAARIHHPHVAAIFDLGRVEQSYFIAMEYVHGQNLSDILRKTARLKKRLSWEFAAQLVADAAAGLHAAHELKSDDGSPLSVVHRDVSPQNLILSADGHLKVVDFGVAYAAERVTYTTDGQVKGKAAYMSPEQVEGEQVDRRSDIFALGTVLFEAVCLRRLFKAKTNTATMLKVRAAEVPQLRDFVPNVPPQLDQIVHKALARDPADRFATAQQLEESLQKLLMAEGKMVNPTSLAQLLDELFHDRLKRKAKQLRHALQNPFSNVKKGVGVGWDTSSSSELSGKDISTAPMPSSSGAKRWWLLGGGAAGLLALTVVLIIVFGGRGDRQPNPKKSATIQPMARPTPRPRMVLPMVRPALPTTVTVKIKVKPEDAPVVATFRGKKIRSSSIKVMVKRSNKSETFEFEAKGFVTRSVVVVPTQDTSLVLTLKKTKPSSMRPRVRSMRSTMYYLEDLPK